MKKKKKGESVSELLPRIERDEDHTRSRPLVIEGGRRRAKADWEKEEVQRG